MAKTENHSHLMNFCLVEFPAAFCRGEKKNIATQNIYLHFFFQKASVCKSQRKGPKWMRVFFKNACRWCTKAPPHTHPPVHPPSFLAQRLFSWICHEMWGWQIWKHQYWTRRLRFTLWVDTFNMLIKSLAVLNCHAWLAVAPPLLPPTTTT